MTAADRRLRGRPGRCSLRGQQPDRPRRTRIRDRDEVRAERTQPRDDEVFVRFHVKPGPTLAVARVTFVGNHEISDEEFADELELAAQPRSGSTSGFIAADDLSDD